MKRIKVKLKGKGTRLDPFRVNLPTYTMDGKRDAQGNLELGEDGLPLDSVDYKAKTCYVMLPNDEAIEVSGKWKIHKKGIRKKYKDQKPWDTDAFEGEEIEA